MVLFLPLQCSVNTNLFPDSVKLIECLISAFIAVSSNLFVVPSLRTKIVYFLLSTCTELSSTPKNNNIFALITVS